MLFLLLQVQFFTMAVKTASDRPPRIPAPFVRPLPSSPTDPRAIAWVRVRTKDDEIYPTTIYVTNDFLATAPQDIQVFAANHEVCHIKLGHHLRYMSNVDSEVEVGMCMGAIYGANAKPMQDKFDMYVVKVLYPLRRDLLR